MTDKKPPTMKAGKTEDEKKNGEDKAKMVQAPGLCKTLKVSLKWKLSWLLAALGIFEITGLSPHTRSWPLQTGNSLH